ncbi:MAG: hypothetical protein HYW25_03140 [Candidatus Aenigmarchaeota archaeon]|nr:hypothetical protein [Candidatus Aenigmarchaeota archaeon]
MSPLQFYILDVIFPDIKGSDRVYVASDQAPERRIVSRILHDDFQAPWKRLRKAGCVRISHSNYSPDGPSSHDYEVVVKPRGPVRREDLAVLHRLTGMQIPCFVSSSLRPVNYGKDGKEGEDGNFHFYIVNVSWGEFDYGDEYLACQRRPSKELLRNILSSTFRIPGDVPLVLVYNGDTDGKSLEDAEERKKPPCISHISEKGPADESDICTVQRFLAKRVLMPETYRMKRRQAAAMDFRRPSGSKGRRRL